jgi:DNA repair protein RecO (recombination protein O)
MPKILKTKGICLGSQRVRESSKIITFYTEHHGKLTFIGKGARNPSSKFGSALEIFGLAELIFYKTEPKQVYTLSDAFLIDPFSTLKIPDKYLYAHQIVELILRATSLEDPNHKLYLLLHNALKILDANRFTKSKNHQSLLSAYYLKVMSILGFKPELRHCVVCKNPKGAYFSIEHGGVVCGSDKHNIIDSTYGIQYIKTIKYLLSTPLSKSLQFSPPQLTLKLTQDYAKYHLENVQINSLQFNPDNK